MARSPAMKPVEVPETTNQPGGIGRAGVNRTGPKTQLAIAWVQDRALRGTPARPSRSSEFAQFLSRLSIATSVTLPLEVVPFLSRLWTTISFTLPLGGSTAQRSGRVPTCWLCPRIPSPETRKLVSDPPGEVVQFISRFTAGGTPGGQRGQRSWHGDTSTQREQVGSDGMTQTHLLALRACISGSSERKHASPRCPVGLPDLLAGLKGPHTIALPDNTNQSTRVIQRLINCTTCAHGREGEGKLHDPPRGRVTEHCATSSREDDGFRKLHGDGLPMTTARSPCLRPADSRKSRLGIGQRRQGC